MGDVLIAAYTYAVAHQQEIFVALGQHLILVALPMAIGLGLGLPLGVWAARGSGGLVLGAWLITVMTGLRVIPSLAILFLAIPYTGLGWLSALLALIILVLPPIVVNTDLGLRSLPVELLMAADSLGMNRHQRFWWVEVPLALPTILVGIKTAILEAIASATLAAFIGAGGLGTFITLGFAVYDPAILLVGALSVACLALLAELGFSLVQLGMRFMVIQKRN